MSRLGNILNGLSKDDRCFVKELLNSKEQQFETLKAKYDNLYKCYQKTSQEDLKDKYDLAKENDKLQQQLKEKDELVSRLRQDHKYEMHQLYVNLNAIAKQEERKQVCEKIREFCEHWRTTDDFTNVLVMYKENVPIRTQPTLSERLDEIEKGESLGDIYGRNSGVKS